MQRTFPSLCIIMMEQNLQSNNLSGVQVLVICALRLSNHRCLSVCSVVSRDTNRSHGCRTEQQTSTQVCCISNVERLCISHLLTRLRCLHFAMLSMFSDIYSTVTTLNQPHNNQEFWQVSDQQPSLQHCQSTFDLDTESLCTVMDRQDWLSFEMYN